MVWTPEPTYDKPEISVRATTLYHQIVAPIMSRRSRCGCGIPANAAQGSRTAGPLRNIIIPICSRNAAGIQRKARVIV